MIRRVVLFATPLALVILELMHPLNAHDTSPTWWTTLHLIQMPLFGLIGLAGYLLVRRDGIEGWAAPIVATLNGDLRRLPASNARWSPAWERR